MKIKAQNNLLYTNVFNNAESKNVQFPSFSKTEDDIPVKISFSDEGRGKLSIEELFELRSPLLTQYIANVKMYITI